MTTDKSQRKAADGKSEPLDKTLSNETNCPAEAGQDTVESSSVVAHKWVGKQLGKYQVTGVIGWGGMGYVLKAHDPTIERDVAIKVLPENLASNPTFLSRFRSEAKAAGKLSHANVTAIYEIGQEGAANYLVMELLTGGSIADELEKQGAYSPLEATRVLSDACQGIAAAHAAKLIHRDIKPANLVRASDRSVKVTDFGLAKLSHTGDTQTTQLTQAGVVIGTPYFMSPEQCQSEAVDARTDIYALGATYYCLLTGKQPFADSGGILQVMYAHCNEKVPDPRLANPAVPSACAAIVARAMAKDPNQRYQRATEMAADLQAVAAALSGEMKIDLPSLSGGSLPALSALTKAINRRVLIASGGLLLGMAIVAVGAWQWGAFSQQDPQLPVALQGEPIKVGVLQSLSGTMSSSGTSVIDATLLAIKEINESGGLLGRPVQAVVADGRSNDDTFAAEAQRLIVEEKVCVVFGCWTSSSRKSVKPVVEEHDHLLIYPVKYEGMETSPNIVYMGAAPNQQIIPALVWANESLGKKRFFLIGSDYVFPRAASEVIKDQMQSIDAEVVGESYVPLGSTEFEAAVQAIVQAKPDMILNMLAGDSNTVFFRTLRAAGIRSEDLPCLSFSMGEQELRSLDIADVEHDYSALTYFQSLDNPANAAFVKRFTEEQPQRVVSDPMEAAYVGVRLWAQAVREAESIEPKKVRRAMLTQRLHAPEGELRLDPDTQHCFKTPRVGQIQSDGQFRIVFSAEEPIRPEPFPASRSAAQWKAFLHDLHTAWGNQWTAPSTR